MAHTFLVIFAAEFGDLTQLATAALTAQSHQPVSIFLGAFLALFAVTVIAAVAGTPPARYLSANLLQRGASAALFAAVGVVLIITALR